MDCQLAQNLLCARLDREITPDESDALDVHLRTCPFCRGTAEALPGLDADLRRAFAPRRLAADAVAQRVIARMAFPLDGPRRVPPWVPLLLSAAAGFLLAVALFRPWEQPPRQTARVHALPVIRERVSLAFATGPVEVQDPETRAWRTVKPGESVELGCWVKTKPDVRCEFRTADQSEVRVNGDTELAIHSSRHLNLTRGQILASVADAEDPFEVRLADATITTRGKLQQFDVSCTDSGALLTVLEGSARVQTDTATDVVNAGEAVRVAAGQLAEKRRRATHQLIESTRWVHDILMLKGHDNRELSRRVDRLLAEMGDQKQSVFRPDELRALGEACVLPLTRYLQDPRCREPGQEHRREQAAEIVADLAAPRSIPDLIELLAHDDGEVRVQAARGLERLTRQTQGCAPEAWRGNAPEVRKKTRQEWENWWTHNRSRFALTK